MELIETRWLTMIKDSARDETFQKFKGIKQEVVAYNGGHMPKDSPHPPCKGVVANHQPKP